MKIVVSIMEMQCRKQKIKFLPNISICVSISSSEAENEGGEIREREREKREREREREKRKRERENNELMKPIQRTQEGFIRAHKPEKDYPARLITSHIGAPQEALAAHINEILKPFIANNKYVCKNSFEFVEKIKDLNLTPLDKMISFDATALFPSIPIEDCINLINIHLKKDNDLPSRTKLTPDDITGLISLCLSSSNFIYDDRHHTQEDSGPIGLSLMVTIAQLWMIHTIETAMKTAKDRGLTAPRHLTVYMDDCWGIIQHRRPGLRSSTAMPDLDPAAAFQELGPSQSSVY